jgi:hypothetical protein
VNAVSEYQFLSRRAALFGVLRQSLLIIGLSATNVGTPGYLRVQKHTYTTGTGIMRPEREVLPHISTGRALGYEKYYLLNDLEIIHSGDCPHASNSQLTGNYLNSLHRTTFFLKS